MTQACVPCGLRCRLCSRTRASAFFPPPVERGHACALISALSLPGAGKRQRPEQEPSARPTPNETRGPRAGRRVCACARVRASRARGDGRHVGAAARGAVRRRGLPHPAQVRPRDPQPGAKRAPAHSWACSRESRACVLACTFVCVRARLSCCVHACIFVCVCVHAHFQVTCMCLTCLLWVSEMYLCMSTRTWVRVIGTCPRSRLGTHAQRKCRFARARRLEGL